MRLIDADALLEAIYKIYGAKHAPHGIINLITNAPSVQREGWVSVEDRLPEKDGEVLVCAETDDGQCITSMRFDGKDFWHEGEQTYCHSYYCSPTHWQPLPPAPTDKE